MDLFAKNMKGWPENSKIWCVEHSDCAEKKTRNKIFLRAAPLCANNCQIFFLNWIIKNICCC